MRKIYYDGLCVHLYEYFLGPLRIYCCWIKNFKTDYLGFLGFLGECCIMCVSRFRGSSVTSLGSVPA